MTAPPGEPQVCGHVWTSEGLSCARPRGHEAKLHHDANGLGWWVDSAGVYPTLDAPTAKPGGWRFDRYVDGRLKAEGVRVIRASTLAEACRAAAEMASPGSVLVLADDSAESARLRAELAEAQGGLAYVVQQLDPIVGEGNNKPLEALVRSVVSEEVENARLAAERDALRERIELAAELLRWARHYSIQLRPQIDQWFEQNAALQLATRSEGQ